MISCLSKINKVNTGKKHHGKRHYKYYINVRCPWNIIHQAKKQPDNQ
jgi:hypothetical protein